MKFVWIDNKVVNFELDMAVDSFSLDVLTEVIKLNYGEFFLSVKERFLGFVTSLGMENTPMFEKAHGS